MNDYEKGIRKAQGIYRQLHSGGCKILAMGTTPFQCDCFLCQCDREIEHIKTLEEELEKAKEARRYVGR